MKKTTLPKESLEITLGHLIVASDRLSGAIDEEMGEALRSLVAQEDSFVEKKIIEEVFKEQLSGLLGTISRARKSNVDVVKATKEVVEELSRIVGVEADVVFKTTSVGCVH